MSDPIAYLITFRTYGTWLHGDERGSVDRKHNAFKGLLLPPNESLRLAMATELKSEPGLLTPAARKVVTETIYEVSIHRGWTLHACAARSNHVHVLVSADDTPECVMNTLKSWCTRRLRDKSLVGRNVPVWSRHGSTKYLWHQRSLEDAGKYVVEGQGDEL